MFTQSCFIRKNTPELRQYLDKIGYKYGGKATKFDQPYLYCSSDKYFECNSFPARYHGIIDCADNENLFKAIASLRDDKPDYQWFVWDDENDKGDKFKQYIPNEYWEEWWWFEVHKASVEELIEHHIINE
jgi:hypothetical protein